MKSWLLPVAPGAVFSAPFASAQNDPTRTGAGGTAHLAVEYFKLSTGTDLVHIPYKGTGRALTDLAGGSVQVMISALPGSLALIQGKPERSRRLR